MWVFYFSVFGCNFKRVRRQSSFAVLLFFSTALLCPVLTAPQNGTVHCPFGRTTGSMCSFSCDAGFTLIGSSRRICRTNTIWTGTLTFCRSLQCVSLEPPKNGVIVSPCHYDYRSTCTVLCTFGYTLEGPGVQTCILNSQTGAVHWTEPPMCNGESSLFKAIVNV